MLAALRPCCCRARSILSISVNATHLKTTQYRRIGSTTLPVRDQSIQVDEHDEVDLEDLGQSSQLSSILAGPSKRPEVVVTRPTRFNKPGLSRDILQYLKDFPHALLLCRVGQFYEVSGPVRPSDTFQRVTCCELGPSSHTPLQSYFDQAIEISDILKIRLTSKSMEGTRYPMCGFPIAQLDKSLEKLVRTNNRFVAICDEQRHYDDKGSLKAITRKVVRVVTPGMFLAFFVCFSSISLPRLTLWRFMPPQAH